MNYQDLDFVTGERSSAYISFYVKPRNISYLQEHIDYGDFKIFTTGDWKLNRFIKEEHKRLVLSGVAPIWNHGEDWNDMDIDGYCLECGKDHQSYNEFCCRECQLNYGLKNETMKMCSVCKEPFRLEQLVEHHICYETDETICVCRACHAKIHHSSDSQCTKYQPIDKRPIREPKKSIKCDKCGCQTYKPQQYQQYNKKHKREVVTVCCKCYKENFKESQKKGKIETKEKMERKWNYMSFYK